MSKSSSTSADDWLRRSYDDFLQQSVECGSFINFNPPAVAKVAVTPEKFAKLLPPLTNSKNGVDLPISKENEVEEEEEKKKGGNENDRDKLVLIKYKSRQSDDPRHSLQKRREFHSLLLFVFFLFVTIITLSQIIVMHSQTSQSNFYQIKLMQEELKLMDASIDRMLKEKHVLPMQVLHLS
jgi:hypothetical protein